MNPRNTLLIAVVLTAIGSTAWAQSAPDQLTERNDVTVPLSAVLPHTPNEGYGGPRVLRVDYNNDGKLDSSDRVFMYVTGVEDFSAQTIHDKIFLFQNENTFGGWNNAYDLAPRTTILPKSGTGCVGCDTNVNYGQQWVYEWNDSIYMLAGVGEGAAHQWPKILLGTSSDGINFQWERWLKASNDWSLLRPAWVEVQISGGTYFYGFIDLKDRANGPFGLGALRYDPVNQRLWFVVNGGWDEIPTCASVGDTSGFRFCLFNSASDPEGTSIDPDLVVPGDRHPGFHKLSRHGGKLELWASRAAPAVDENCPPDDGLSNWQNAFSYREVSPPANLTEPPVLGTKLILKQELTNPVRCNPASYQHSRKTPFRLDWTIDLFYSRSWDDPNDPFGPNTTGPEGYIVRTRLGVR